jgi:hypothetical protein
MMRDDYIIVNPAPPMTNFTANITAGYSPLTVQFNDISTGSPTTWSWLFGDGTESIEQHPIHTYTAPENYTVTLTTTTNQGISTETKQGLIAVHLRSDFNRNGGIDIGDVSKVAWMAAKIIDADLEADFNGDGIVDIADAAWIAYYYVGKIPTL